MLERTVALAELAQRAQSALGSGPNSLSHPYSLETLVLVDPTGWSQAGGSWLLDVQPEDLQLATLTHAEMATDRFCCQMATVLRLVIENGDPHWTAVACYYAAFYAAQALLLQVGRGAVRVRSSGAKNAPYKGIYSVASFPSQLSVGRRTVALTPISKGSHRATWSQVNVLLDELLKIESSNRAIVVLKTLQAEIMRPVLLSDARNEINYDLTSSPYTTTAWSSLLIDIAEPEGVEDVLARATQSRAERRFEIVALALGCLAAQLRRDLKLRRGKLDRRQTIARAAELPQRPWLC